MNLTRVMTAGVLFLLGCTDLRGGEGHGGNSEGGAAGASASGGDTGAATATGSVSNGGSTTPITETIAALIEPSDGATIEGAIPVEGWASSPGGLERLLLRVSWAGEAGRDLVLCADNCYGATFDFMATLGPEGIEAPAGALTLGLYEKKGGKVEGPFAEVSVNWSPKATTCFPGAPGPKMVEIPGPQGGTTCIDSTEVTKGHYQSFLGATNGGLDVGIEGLTACEENTTYLPYDEWPPSGDERRPVVWIDWCDAYAFCKWAGKRLCGAPYGGATSFPDFGTPEMSQWSNACMSGPALHYYAYGDEYTSTKCNDSDNPDTGCNNTGKCKIVPAGSLALCQPAGEYQGVFDLSGNVQEWEDAHWGTEDTYYGCRLRGGASWASWSGAWHSTCGFDNEASCTYADGFIGFRCCGP